MKVAFNLTATNLFELMAIKNLFEAKTVDQNELRGECSSPYYEIDFDEAWIEDEDSE